MVHQPGGLAVDPLLFHFFSPRLGLILLAIPKNGCTTQKRWLLEAEGLPSDQPHKDAGRLCIRTHPDASMLLANAPVVCFVRDPWLRLVSAYRSKLCAELNFPAISAIEGVAAARGTELVRDTSLPCRERGPNAHAAVCSGVDYERGLSFREFVGHVASTPDLGLDRHWRPQSWFLSVSRPRLLADVGVISPTLGELGKRIALPAPAGPPRSLGLAPGVGTLADTPSGTIRNKGIGPTPSELYTPELVERVRERYAADAGIHASLGVEQASEKLAAA